MSLGVSRLAFAPLLAAGLLSALAADRVALAQQASISAYDAADFRIWGYIPYWASATTISNLATNGMYAHVSDVLYFGAVRPNNNGNLPFASTTYSNNLATLRSLKQTHGFDLHLSVFEVIGGQTDATWTTIVNDPSKRGEFVEDVVALMQGGAGTADDLAGFNFDWERPRDWDREPGEAEDPAVAAALWGNYTQLAREVRTAINPLGMEVSVCDYGSTDFRWDNTNLFDAKVYDQLFMMSYHLSSSSSATYANQKDDLDDQGAAKAFSDDQIAVGFGVYADGIDPDGPGGASAPASRVHSNIVANYPNLAFDTSVITEGSNSWNIESRKQVREKTQLAIDRNMPGIFSWTLHNDATNDLGLHRVAHHYLVFKKGVPDLNLDGKVSAADATALANQMGTVPGWTGTNTPERFEKFYIQKNWEKGDRDGNGFVNQVDADWLAGRFASLGVNLPDRLAYSGTFENFASSFGTVGRWEAKRETAGNLRETGNFTQLGATGLTWSGSGVGASKRSNNYVTIRNQNSAESVDPVFTNTLPRMLSVDLASPIDLSKNTETYFTFLVRSNTSGLLSSQMSSLDRVLALEFLDSAGVNQFDFAFRGFQQRFYIQSQADVAGQDSSAGGFAPNTAYLVVGKVAGNGAGANTLSASIFGSGANVGNFASASFPWAMTAQSSAAFNPTITQLQFSSLYQGSFTVSNVWIGSSADFFALPSSANGDFNGDGVVDGADIIVWKKLENLSGTLLPADADGDGTVDQDDLLVWQRNYGRVLSGGGGFTESSQSNVPEPTALLLAAAAGIMAMSVRRR
jgi:GH18 family chitinase